MTERVHECEFWWNEDEADVADNPFVCECGEYIGAVEALDRMNASEKLSAEIVLQNIIIYGEGGFVTDQFLDALKAYANTREGI
jgi:hypothetical protein